MTLLLDLSCVRLAGQAREAGVGGGHSQNSEVSETLSAQKAGGTQGSAGGTRTSKGQVESAAGTWGVARSIELNWST